MLNSAINYPYPLLRSKTGDYLHSVFNATINVKSLTNGYEINVDYHLDNPEMIELIAGNKASFALEIQCISTWYRRLEISSSEKQVLFIPSTLIHERVDLCPCIVAIDSISDFHSGDFAEEYNSLSIPINMGEVLAIGERKKFDALYKDDIIRKSESIVSFKVDEHATTMFCEWEYEIIQIHLPPKQYDEYNRIGKWEPWKIPLLNAIYIIPVIVEAITFIYQDECQGGSGGLSSYAWYKTLKFLIGKIANNNAGVYRKLLSDSVGTAQKLMNDNSAAALVLLGKASKQ